MKCLPAPLHIALCQPALDFGAQNQTSRQQERSVERVECEGQRIRVRRQYELDDIECANQSCPPVKSTQARHEKHTAAQDYYRQRQGSSNCLVDLPIPCTDEERRSRTQELTDNAQRKQSRGQDEPERRAEVEVGQRVMYLCHRSSPLRTGIGDPVCEDSDIVMAGDFDLAGVEPVGTVYDERFRPGQPASVRRGTQGCEYV